MTEIISVRFRPGGKQYYFDPAGLTVAEGQNEIGRASCRERVFRAV